MKKELKLSNIDDGNELLFQKNEKTIIFSSTYIQKIKNNKNSTVINLGKCENKLKTFYNISEESYLYILIIDVEQKDKNYPKIEYEVFYRFQDGNMEMLNLSICEDIDIEISYPVNISDDIDKYNPKSDYYNDICSKATSNSKTDITLEDRMNEYINNNLSLCEDNCEFVNYDEENKIVNCSCKVKTFLSLTLIDLNKKILMQNFLNINKITNIGIMKCYNKVFNKDNIIKNYGSFIIIFIFIIFLMSMIIFYCKSLQELINIIDKITKKIELKSNNQKIKNNNINNNIIKTKKVKDKNRKSIKNENISNKRKINPESNLIRFKSNKQTKKDNINKRKKQSIFNDFKNKNKIINIQGKNKNKYIYNESQLNSLSYQEARMNDKRSFSLYYFSLLKQKQLIVFSFYPIKDYNPRIIKIFLFFFFFSSHFAVNALFFTDNTMHEIYINSGAFNLNYQLPQIIYSFLITGVINKFIKYLSLSEKIINSIKDMKTNQKINLNIISTKKRILKIKYVLFFITTLIILFAFWFYISCFCCIYQNTQIHLIKDSLISFAL